MVLKRRSKTWYKKNAIALAKEIARRKGFCEYCQSTEKQLQGSHIFPVAYIATAADPDNILCLCAGCHKFSRDAWHRSPEIGIWFFKNQTERYERLYNKAKEGVAPDWAAVFYSLKEFKS